MSYFARTHCSDLNYLRHYRNLTDWLVD